MNADQSYSPTALLNRGKFAEVVTAKLLRSVFGTSSVYTDVEVKERKGRNVTDIDVLAIAGNKAVVAQVKSKRLTELARLGEEKRLVGHHPQLGDDRMGFQREQAEPFRDRGRHRLAVAAATDEKQSLAGR